MSVGRPLIDYSMVVQNDQVRVHTDCEGREGTPATAVHCPLISYDEPFISCHETVDYCWTTVGFT